MWEEALKRIWTVLARGKITILCFHKVPVERDPFNAGEIDIGQFRSLVQTMSEIAKVVPLEYAVNKMMRQKGDKPMCAITFDDGYPNWLSDVVPVLEELSLPATFFISSGQLSGHPLWNERIINAISFTKKHSVTLESGSLKLKIENLEELRGRVEAGIVLDKAMKYLPMNERMELIQQLESALNVEARRAPRMELEDIKAIHSKGFDIGSHSINHPILSLSHEKEARLEIEESKSELEAIISDRVNLFAYPNGQANKDYQAAHVEMVRQAGYEAAFTTEHGVASIGVDRYQIPRFTPWGPSREKVIAQSIRNLYRQIEYAK